MKVSIITPVLNRVDDLHRTLQSVVTQSYHDIELVVVDGASTDGSVDIIREFATRYPKLVRWISEPDDGVYAAINKGLAMATGDILGTLHAGDYLVSTGIISRIVDEFLRNPDTPYIYGDVHFFAPSGQCVRLYSGLENMEKGMRYGIAPPHPSFYMHRKLLDVIGGYREDYEIAADFELFVRLSLVHGIQGRYIPLDMVGMSLGGLSTKLRNRLINNNKEKMRALRENGVSRHGLGVFRRYFFTLIQ